MKIKYFPIETGVFQRDLYTGSAKNIKFEILGCLEAFKDCK